MADALRSILEADRALKGTTISDERGTDRRGATHGDLRTGGRVTRLARCLFALLLAGARPPPRRPTPGWWRPCAAQEGRGDSARVAVDRLLAATAPADTLYPQILYTQAMVADTAGDMRRHLQRVAVEYSTSSWADDALLRLVQMDYATRNYENAARNLERLRVDFPLTPLLPRPPTGAAAPIST